MQTRNYSMTAHTELKDILINHVRETGNYNRWVLEQFCDVLEVPVEEYCAHSVGKRLQFCDPTELEIKYARLGRVATPMTFEEITSGITSDIVEHYLGTVPALGVYLDEDQVVRIYSSAAEFGEKISWMRSPRIYQQRLDRRNPFYSDIAKRTPVHDVLCDGKLVLYKVPASEHFLAVDKTYRGIAKHGASERTLFREAVAKLVADNESTGDRTDAELLTALTVNVLDVFDSLVSDNWCNAITEDVVLQYLKTYYWKMDEKCTMSFEPETFLDGCKAFLSNTGSYPELVDKILLSKARTLANRLIRNDQTVLTLVAGNF